MARCTAFLLALVAAVANGCGKPAYQLETAPVHGKVTLDGQPVASGYVVVPATRGRMASGKIQPPGGTFVLSTYEDGDGAQVGTHPVIVNEVPPDEFSSIPRHERIPIPSKYTAAGTSGLTVEVKPGEDNVLDIALFSTE